MSRKMRFILCLMTGGLMLCSAALLPAQGPVPKPDLVVEKVHLNPAGNIVIEIRNAGPGLLPENVWVVEPGQSAAACFVIMIGVQFVDYAAFWSADVSRSLRQPGGSITYTSPVRIQEPTRVRVWIDPLEQIEEVRKNNNIKEILLTP